MRKRPLFILSLIAAVALSPVSGAVPVGTQPVYEIDAKIIHFDKYSRSMKIYIERVGKLVVPGRFGSHSEVKYTAKKELEVIGYVDVRDTQVKNNCYVTGYIQLKADPKGNRYEFKKIKYLASNWVAYQLKKDVKNQIGGTVNDLSGGNIEDKSPEEILAILEKEGR